MDHFSPPRQVVHYRAPKATPEQTGTGTVRLSLEVSDAEVVDVLQQQPEGRERDEYALDALRIGVLALRHASGRLDADLLRHETTRLVETLDEKLNSHARTTHDRVQSSLKEYFDPASGRFNERVRRLVAEDGELPQLLKQHLAGDHSQLARTLTAHVGRKSPLMKLLDPEQSAGLLAALRELVEKQLTAQNARVLSEFSLDNDDGALARLVRELTSKHGDLSKDLRAKIDEVVKEFSLDAEDSALNRLKKKLDDAHQTITGEFSLNNEQSAFSQLKKMLADAQGSINKNLTLDEEDSPLARLKRELMTILEAHVKTNAEFQEKVVESLAKLTQKKETEAKSTLHGHTFEQAVYDFLSRDCQTCGHVIEATGNRTGFVTNSKKGDIVVTLGVETDQPVSIVFEAKQDRAFDVPRALQELDDARKNRQAEVGVFVFSRQSAPDDLLPLKRYGNNVIVVWDADDPTSDPYLHAALEFAKAFCADRGRKTTVGDVDFDAIEKAILAIEKAAGNLDVINSSAETIQKQADKILDRVRKDRKHFALQIDRLRDAAERIHEAVAGAI